MKKLFKLLLIIFSTQSCFSQNHIIIDSISNIQLNGNWKFHAGDNPEWANKDIDEAGWINLSLDKPLPQLPKEVLNEHGWYRLHFTIDKFDSTKLIALLVDQYGASEIYIDGVLQKQIGSITSFGKYKPFNPHNQPIPVSFNNKADHVIAVRFFYTVPLSDRILQQVDVPPFSMRLQYLSTAIAEREDQLKSSRNGTGFAFAQSIFALLFLLLYVFYPRQKLNLFFSLFSFFVVLHFLDNLLQNEGQFSLTQRVYLIYADGFFNPSIGMSILLFILTALFNRVQPVFRWFIIFTIFVDIPLYVIFGKSVELFGYFVYIAANLIWLGLAFYVFIKRRNEDLLIGLISISLVISNGSFILFHFTGVNFVALGQTIVSIVIPLCMIIYLALRYARTNRSLERQFVQLKELSEKTIQQEQEKQQMLALQNEILEEKVTQRTSELKHSLDELKSTQAQLIQSEKMASLGELTAGIAHEIQNPLNFVNNFSEVNRELIEELKSEKSKLKNEEVDELLDDIAANEEKINHHGKRADAIVKNMLQHSKQTSGTKEPTNINALCDEYLRLSYHGLRAKDKSFNADFKTDFDESIGKINIVPQDIGRVLLNIINNAFYATNEKKKTADENYKPLVSVQTKKLNDKIEIKVSDNGNGIPQNIIDKIFQPFFTTKPTGQGTGLGLSLAYDIINKEHNGSIKVESKQDEGSEFVINLPLNS